MGTVGIACMVCQDSIVPLERAKYYPLCDKCLEILRGVVEEKRKQAKTLRQTEEKKEVSSMGKLDCFRSYMCKVRNIPYELWMSRAFRAVAEQTRDEYERYLERRPLTKKFPDFRAWIQAWLAVEGICRRKALEYRDGIRI